MRSLEPLVYGPPPGPSPLLDVRQQELGRALLRVTQGVVDVVGLPGAAVAVRTEGGVRLLAGHGTHDALDVLGCHRPLDELAGARLLAAAPEGAARWMPGAPGRPAVGLILPLLHESTGRTLGALVVALDEDQAPADTVKGSVLLRRLEWFARLATQTLADQEALVRVQVDTWLSQFARRVVRRAGAQLDADQVFAETLGAVAEGLRADAVWARSWAVEPAPVGVLQSSESAEVPHIIPVGVLTILELWARALWRDQAVLVVDQHTPCPEGGDPDSFETLARMRREGGVATWVVAPIGVGDDCLGYVTMSRCVGAQAWTEAEQALALDVGRDLGRAVANSRTLAREQRVVAELERLDEHKRELIAMFSHELRTPLTSITGHLELLEDDTDAAALDRSLPVLRRSASRLESLIGDLLLLSELADADRPTETRAVDVGELAERLVSSRRPEALAREVALSVEVAVPPGAGPGGRAGHVVRGNRGELDRALTHLVDNALAYTDAGGRAEVRVGRVGDRVVVEVCDTGVGIDPCDHARVFEDFFRAADVDRRPDARRRPGAGVGLRVVDRVVRRHGGEVTLASAPGAGSTVTVSLPAS